MPFTPQSSTRTVSDVITQVRRTIGDQAGVLFGDTDGLSWVNAGQREIADRLDLFGEATVDLVAGQSEYVIPVEISQRIRDLQSILVGGKRLRPMTYLQAQAQWMDPGGDGFPEPGDPVWWFQRNQTVTIVPAPEADVAAGMTVQFARQAIDLPNTASTLDIPDTHFNRLVEYVLQQAYLVTQEVELAGIARASMEEGLRSVARREGRSQTASYFAITPDEDLY